MLLFYRPFACLTLKIGVWVESASHDTIRIQVKHVLSGATRTFLQWSQVIEFIEAEVEHHKPNQARF